MIHDKQWLIHLMVGKVRQIISNVQQLTQRHLQSKQQHNLYTLLHRIKKTFKDLLLKSIQFAKVTPLKPFTQVPLGRLVGDQAQNITTIETRTTRTLLWHYTSNLQQSKQSR